MPVAVVAAHVAGLGAPNVQTASYQLAASDSAVEMNAASGTVVTVPPYLTVPFPVGTVIDILRYGAGAVTVQAGSGVTLRSRSSLTGVANRYGSVSLRKIALNEWLLTGDLG